MKAKTLLLRLLALTLPALNCPVGFSLPDLDCRSVFSGSLREAQARAIQKVSAVEKYRPRFIDLMAEARLAKRWDLGKKSPARVLSAILPKGVSFVGHRLRESQAPNVVKFPAHGESLIVRANYSYKSEKLKTNVTVSKAGLIGNLESENNWLVGPSVEAGILFLHGGGTKSTGGHVAESIANHFHKYNIAVISPDLPWHGEGPRTFMGTLDDEIKALSALTKKYVHPSVPLFVWGHSWGGSIAHRIMQMSDKEADFFHSNLKGLIITSPAVDPAPGEALSEKKKEYIKRRKKAMELEDQVAPREKDLFKQMLADGKTSPVGEFFSTLTIAQLDDQIPLHKGAEYLPTLMIVGVGDQLVFLGFEDLFRKYYDQLSNVSAHYLTKLPLFIANGRKEEIVGHLLSDYVFGEKSETPVNFELAFQFMKKHAIVQKPEDGSANQNINYKQLLRLDLLDILQLYANDLAFREWVESAEIMQNMKTHSYQKVKNELEGKQERFKEETAKFMPRQVFAGILNDITRKYRSIPPAGSLIFKSLDLSRLKEDIRPYKKFFSRDLGIVRLFEGFEKNQDIESALRLLNKLLKHPLLKPSSKKQIEAFSREILKLDGPESIKSMLEKYPYFSKESLGPLLSSAKEIRQLQQRIWETYIPTVEDYEKADYLKLSAGEIRQRREWIEENIKEREKVNERIGLVSREISILKKKLNQNLDQLARFNKKIRIIFEEAAVIPPPSLKAEHEKSWEAFDELHVLSEKMADVLEDAAYKSLSTGEFTFSNMEKQLSPHQELIDKFSKEYDQYVENRARFRQQLISAMQNGDLTDEAEAVANAIYGQVGLYSETEALSIQLAEKESERIGLKEHKARLVGEYNRWIPFEELSVMHSISVKEILNRINFNSSDWKQNKADYLEQNKALLQDILKAWKSLGSHILPEPPK